MIYIIIGTKGQFVKMFPIMKFFDREKVAYKFIHTCQHYGIIEENRKRLKIRKPDVYLTFKKNDLRNIWDFLRWAPWVLWEARRLPITKEDYVLVHGDAESAILGFLIGKYFRAKVVHVEAGLRSGSFLEPFPEEIVRTIVDLGSDICFCPYKEDAQNIKGNQIKIITNGNTVFDSVRLALEFEPSTETKKIMRTKCVPFLVHRKENLFATERIHLIISILESILKRGYKVIWPVHGNTEHELKVKNVWNEIIRLKSCYDLELSYFLDYVDFMHIVKHCQFVASDGAGLQKESLFLNKPMLIMRKKTEYIPSAGENSYLSFLDVERVNYFLDNLGQFKQTIKIEESPTRIIVDYFKSLK
ncbi:MAG: UDP-N-acetylglucosamine 2-epimerase [Candidatus Gottesmanbacteria bacterium]